MRLVDRLRGSRAADTLKEQQKRCQKGPQVRFDIAGKTFMYVSLD